MRKLLLLVSAIAVLSLAVNAGAQIPYVQVFYDKGASVAQKDCPGVSLDDLYVFAINYNMYIAAIQYWVSLPGCFTLTGTTLPPGGLSIGDPLDPVSGISLSYPVPGDGTAPFVTMTMHVVWNCTDCVGWEITPIVVGGFAMGFVQAISWPDLNTKLGVGMTSYVCAFPPIPTEQTTWGNVKSLYR